MAYYTVLTSVFGRFAQQKGKESHYDSHNGSKAKAIKAFIKRKENDVCINGIVSCIYMIYLFNFYGKNNKSLSSVHPKYKKAPKRVFLTYCNT